MKLDLKTIIQKLEPVKRLLKQYAVFCVVIFILGIAAFFVFRINQYSQIEPADDAITDKLQKVSRPKVDQSVLDKIEQLRSQNIQVQALFEKARENPFSE